MDTVLFFFCSYFIIYTAVYLMQCSYCGYLLRKQQALSAWGRGGGRREGESPKNRNDDNFRGKVVGAEIKSNEGFSGGDVRH